MTVENFFLRHCVKNLNIFWAMYKLQRKGKENLERINQLIKSQEPKNKKDEALLAQVVVKRQEVQKEIDYLLDKTHIE